VRHLADFAAAFGASTRLDDITSSKISAWKAAKLAATCPMTGELYAAATINRPLATLRHLMLLARDEWEVLTTVPRIRQEREPQGRLRWLDEEEIKALLAACERSASASSACSFDAAAPLVPHACAALTRRICA